MGVYQEVHPSKARRISSGSGASKSAAIRSRPLSCPTIRSREGVERHESRNRSSCFGDDDFLSGGHTHEKPRKMRLGLVDLDFHLFASAAE